jgi:flagellar assembly protein FliH
MPQPVIKRNDADEMFGPGQAFSFQSVEERARTIIAQARAEAAEEVRRAKLEVDRMREEVRGEEFEAARKDGFDKGYEEGFSEGLERGQKGAMEHKTKALNEQIGELPEILKSIVSEVEARRTRLVEECDRDLLSLAFSIAERFTRLKLEQSPSTVMESLREAIDLVLNRATLDIFVATQDLHAIEVFLPALRKEFTDIGAVQLHADPQLSRGSVIVRTGRGKVSSSVEDQINHIAKALVDCTPDAALERMGFAKPAGPAQPM